MGRLPAATLALLMILIVTMVLTINTVERVREFGKMQYEIQEAVVNGAAYAASKHILEVKKMVLLFADEYRDMIATLAIYPGDEITRAALRERLRQRFDNVFTFTIATPEGVPVLSDIETKVGAVCQRDLSEFSAKVARGHPLTHNNKLVIHPNPSGYHYDVMAPFTVSGVARIFFVSFYPTDLAEIAATHAPPGHQLFFVNTDKPRLIEIGAAGARDVLGRDIHLTEEESNRAKAVRNVTGSKWRIIDVPDAGLVTDYKRRLWTEVGIIIAFVALISLIMMMYMIRLCRQCDTGKCR